MKTSKKGMIILPFVFLCLALGSQAWAAKRLTWNSSMSCLPVIALDTSDNIYVVWCDYAAGDSEIYYKKCTEGGTKWSTKRLTWTTDHSYKPAIAIDSDDTVHIVFYDTSTGKNEIYYKNSTNGGTNWTTKRLTWSTIECSYPAIAIDSNKDIHLVWHGGIPGNSEIYYKKSKNGGSTWTGSKRLTSNKGYSLYPSIATDSNNYIHVAWRDGTSGHTEIYYTKTTDGGTTWTPTRLTWFKSFCAAPDIVIDSSDHIYIVWDSLGNIYSKKSTDGGISWTNRKLTWTFDYSVAPAITANPSNNDIHLVWQQSFSSSDSEIYHKKSEDGGVSWASTRLTWNSGQSTVPKIAVDSARNFHVVWQDDTPGNAEIYYTKK
jgi:hypothetical protein